MRRLHDTINDRAADKLRQRRLVVTVSSFTEGYHAKENVKSYKIGSCCDYLSIYPPFKIINGKFVSRSSSTEKSC